MSVTDPIIKELKGWTLKLTKCGTDIGDENEDLPFFCKSIEACFQREVLSRLNAFGFPKLPEAWYWLEEIADRNDSSLFAFTSAVENVRENLKIQNPIGRLRLLIRTCLTRRCLHLPVQYIIRTHHLSSLEYYSHNSILGDEILGEIFLSVLLQISKIYFRLNLRNASFLDDTWQLPECISAEFVPCKSLGMSVCFTKGRALIIKLEENSVAGENEEIEVGDVLDEINGNVITSNTRGRLRKIMRNSSSRPLSLHIVKHRSKKSNDIFEPIVGLIKSSGIDKMKNLLKASPKSGESHGKTSQFNETENKVPSSGFFVKYCGSISTGTEGDVKQIERAIWNLLRSAETKLIPVKFECLEIGIKVTLDSNGTIIFQQSYMEISSCGRTSNIPNYFAFIAGETNCSVATKFDAHVFFHQKENEVQTILQSLGQGFQRTHFAV
ncbi:uncharacterized protein LOC117169634 [Belonocnema kinseyi]|uniref:uncharacterized protein LOC117169634 n=1 Tax=Belonocnema kinseyi TaxID=2817044 RepID=UPI00143CC108|nr:uncharacterized protein LOC117169634 [Belonocnema kinseyi]